MNATLDTGTDVVLAEVRDGVGVVTLNRPERRNALHPDMYRVVPEVLARFIEDDDVRCVLMTGAGTAFCSGGDVRGGTRQRSEPRAEKATVVDMATSLARDARMVVLLHDSPKVTIAALPGPAVGAGLSIALAADLRIAATSASLVTGWAQLGFSGDFGGTWLLAQLLGPSRALAALLQDEPILSDEALRLGLVNRVIDDEGFHEEAFAWARRLAEGSTTASRYFKENVRQAARLTLQEALPLEAERMVLSGRTDEHRAAVRRWLAAAEAKRSKR